METIWYFAWDVMGDGFPERFLVFLPLVWSALLLLVARFAPRRLRGLAYVLGTLAFVVATFVLALDVHVPLRISFGLLPWEGAVLTFLLLLAPPMIAAGNRVHRRTMDPGRGAMVGALGGIGLWVALLLPWQPDLESPDVPNSVIAALVSGSAWSAHEWPTSLWALLVVAYASLALALFARPGPGRALGAVLSLTARVTRFGWPVALFLVAVLPGQGAASSIVPHVVNFVRGSVLIYGTTTLLAVGLARLLEGEPEPPIEAQVFD
jgi:hypothetical protein